MNGYKLLEEVSALGFESAVEATETFIIYVNRALKEIFSDREVESVLRIPVCRKTPAERIPIYRHEPGSCSDIRVSGAAFSFTASGTGECILTEGERRVSYSFDSPRAEIRGFLSGAATLSFIGELSYTVFDISVYRDLFGTEPSDIPIYSSLQSYKINDYAPDFVGPMGAPYTEGGRLPSGIRISADLLLAPVDFEGEVYIPYARAPKELDLDNLGHEIDCPRECEHLLALLTAAYLWLDDDAEKAQYYMSIYKNGMEDIRRRKSRHTGGEFADVLGWA